MSCQQYNDISHLTEKVKTFVVSHNRLEWDGKPLWNKQGKKKKKILQNVYLNGWL